MQWISTQPCRLSDRLVPAAPVQSASGLHSSSQRIGTYRLGRPSVVEISKWIVTAWLKHCEMRGALVTQKRSLAFLSLYQGPQQFRTFQEPVFCRPTVAPPGRGTKLGVWNTVNPDLHRRMFLPKHLSPNDSRPPGVIIRGHYRDRMPSMGLNSVEENLGLFLCGIHIVICFIEDKMANHFLAIEFLIVGVCDRSNSLTPIRFSGDANKYFVGYSLLHKAHRSGDPGLLSQY